MDLQETYDAIAEKWHEEAKRSVNHRPGLDALLERLSPASRMLDIGCGTGLVADRLLRAGMEVVGIDISEGMLSIARRECPRGRFLRMDLTDVARLEGHFDAVCAAAVLLHRPRAELVASLMSFGVKLHTGGLLYVAVKEKRADRPEEGVLAENHLGETIERFFSFYTREEIEKAFRLAGFETIFSEVVPSGRARWIEVVGRKG